MVHEFRLQRKPRFTPGLSRIVQILLTASLILFIGCTGTSPRFGSSSGTSQQSETPAVSPSPELMKQADEEKKEDDVPVDASVKESIVSGTRDFKSEKNPALSNLDASRVMREISKYMGVPYQLGGEGGQGIDCSAYTRLVYRNSLKQELPRTSREQFRSGSPVGFRELQFGDLIFFNTTGDPASHVGIYLGDDLFAHASVTFGVTISSLESSYYKNRFEGARRIIE